jgi:hypothetical protein
MSPQIAPVSVEDVASYFELASDRGATESEETANRVFIQLCQNVHPLVLGQVQRNVNQIRQLIGKMIRLHAPDKENEVVERLSENLTRTLYSHSHQIGRAEATEIGLPIDVPSTAVEELLLEYYDKLGDDLKLLQSFNPAELLQAAQAAQAAASAGAVPSATPSQVVVAPTGSPTVPAPPVGVPMPGAAVQLAAPIVPTPPPPVKVDLVLERAYIETSQTCDAFVTRGSIRPAPAVPMPGVIPGMGAIPGTPLVAVEITAEGWTVLA